MAAPNARFCEYVLKEARKSLTDCDYEKAFSHYLLALKLHQYHSGEIHNEFLDCVCSWTELLSASDRTEEAATAFAQATAVCLHSDTLTCALGEHALR